MAEYPGLNNQIIRFLKRNGESRTLTIKKEMDSLYQLVPKSTIWDHLVKLSRENKIKHRVVRPDQKMGITYWSVIE